MFFSLINLQFAIMRNWFRWYVLQILSKTLRLEPSRIYIAQTLGQDYKGRFPHVMTKNIAEDSRIVGPVTQFVVLIVPVVMNGFYMVYSLTGWILSDRDKLNWALEAESVGLWVCAVMLGFCAVVFFFVRWRGGSWRHILSLSSIVHSLVVILLTLLIFIVVRI